MSADTPEAEPEQHIDEMSQLLEGMAPSDHIPIARAGGIVIGGLLDEALESTIERPKSPSHVDDMVAIA